MAQKLRFTTMAVLALILVITGSYVRVRPIDDQNTADWLVILQLVACIVAGAMGLELLRRSFVAGTKPIWGFGSWMLVAYLAAVLVSALFSPYMTFVLGYWVLLSGAAVVCVGLVASSRDERSLHQVEQVVVATIVLMLLKDLVVDAFLAQAPETDEPHRLGMGVTSANVMGQTAVMAFWMSFGHPPQSKAARFWQFFCRTMLLVIVALTRSRTAFIALAVGAIFRWWLLRRQSRAIRSYAFAMALPCCIVALVAAAALGWTLELPGTPAVADFLNRGEDASTVLSVTGRTDIWPNAIAHVEESISSLALGHGYGASKFVLNEKSWNKEFYAYHSHNTFLEVLLATGILGTIPFVALAAYSLRWIRLSRVRPAFSREFVLRAAAVITGILSSTITESDLAIKVAPLPIVFLFYVLSLDRQAAFERALFYVQDERRAA